MEELYLLIFSLLKLILLYYYSDEGQDTIIEGMDKI